MQRVLFFRLDRLAIMISNRSFFSNQNKLRPLILDENNYFVDEETEIAPHLMGPPRMVDADGVDYDDNIQTMVPGRDFLLRVIFHFRLFCEDLHNFIVFIFTKIAEIVRSIICFHLFEDFILFSIS